MSQNQRPEAGGSFLFQPTGKRRIFTPEQFTDEQKMMFQTAFDFTSQEVLPHTTELESKTTDRMMQLVRKAGELGILSNDIPEEYGGLGGDKVTSMLLAEAISLYGGWSATVMAHNGIGTLPIVYFGTKEQKAKYLPKLASLEWLGAYALTEPGSGSDALAAKCRATKSPDGKFWVLNGTKQFITNGAWASLFIVFAQAETAEGPKFTAFLVERDYKGVSHGPEEHKLGLHGSSTTPLILEDAHVPVENVLGEIGKGHRIAFNVLNVGRWKLGIGSIAGTKYTLLDGLTYARDRKQFGKSILEFGAIRKKVARVAAAIYAGEAMCYRVAGLTDERIATIAKDDAAYDKKIVDAIEEYAIEASVLKVAGSEILAFANDEMLQVHGGYGFLEEYTPARVYRDNRINRIFEGTNEINRMLVPGMILKRAMTGALPLMQAFGEAQGGAIKVVADGPIAVDRQRLENAKTATVLALGMSVGKYMQDLQNQQEILESLADAIIGVFGIDSAIQRSLQKMEDAGEAAGKMHVTLTRAFAAETYPKIYAALRTVIAHIAEGDERAAKYKQLAALEGDEPYDAILLREEIAAYVAEKGKYEI